MGVGKTLGAIAESKPFALGVPEYLEGFARDRGAESVLDYDNLGYRWVNLVEDKIMDPDTAVHVNLDCPITEDCPSGTIDPIEAANQGWQRSHTSWEIQRCRDVGQNIHYWRNGIEIPNPFH